MGDRVPEASEIPVPFLRFGPRPDRTRHEGWQEFRRTRELFVPVRKIPLAEYGLLSPRKKSLHDLHRAATHVNMRMEETPMSAVVTALMRSRIQNNAMRIGPSTLDGLMINGGGYQGKTETACRTAAECEDTWRDLFEQYPDHYLDPMPGTRDLIAPVAYCQTPVKATPIGLGQYEQPVTHVSSGNGVRTACAPCPAALIHLPTRPSSASSFASPVTTARPRLKSPLGWG